MYALLSPGSDILTDKPWLDSPVYFLYILPWSPDCGDGNAIWRCSGQVSLVSRVSQPHTFTLYYRVFTLLRPGMWIFIFIICPGDRLAHWQWGRTGDSNHSRADTLHQTAGLLCTHRMRTQTTSPDTFTAWKIWIRFFCVLPPAHPFAINKKR